MSMTMNEIMTQKITEALEPAVLEVINESHFHAGHLQTSNTETHFRLVIVAAKFEGLTAVKRHQWVYRILAEELAGELHALALSLKTPAEFAV